MNDVNEWSSEYDVKVENFFNLAESPHSWDKRVLNITPVKNGNNESYSLVVEFIIVITKLGKDKKHMLMEQECG